MKKYPELAPGQIRMVLAEPGARILPEVSQLLADYAARKLQARGVEIRLHTRITAVTGNYIEFNGQERLPCHTLIWAGGVTPHPVVSGLACEYGAQGGIMVNAFLAVPRNAGIWALGDCAEVPSRDGGHYGATAQNAAQQGKIVARNIAAVLRGENPIAFKYRPIGELALVGRHAGVGQIMGRKFAGLAAWALWRAFYLFKMPSPGQRFRIVTDWLLDLVVGRSVVLTTRLSPDGKTQAVSAETATV